VLRSILIALLIAAPVAGQSGPEATACPDGRISYVFIDSNSIFDTTDPDLDPRFRWAYTTANKLHVRTRQWVIRHELLFRPGDCYDPFVLSESERVLRGYPFLAQVDIYGIPQTDGTRHVIVDTHDDWSTRVDMRITLDHGIRFEGVRLRELNFLGMGQTLSLFWQEREVTRDYGVSYWAPQLGRSRWDVAAALGRTRAGTLFREEVGYPFTGEIGHWAGREAFSRDEQYFDYILFDDVNTTSPHVLIPIRDERFEASVLRRFGDRGRAWLAGVGLSSRELEFPGPVDVAPDGRFNRRGPAEPLVAGPVLESASPRNAVRLHLLLGARDVRWTKRRGLDGLQGDEDIRLGFELGTDLGRSLPAFGDDDLSAAGLVYAAAELGGSVFGGRGRIDGLRGLGQPYTGRSWQDVFAEIETFAYLRRSASSPGTLLVRADVAGGWNTRTPFQLTLGGERGVRGYDRERFPGGRRILFTVEERYYLGWPHPGLFDAGFTVFADAGRMWAGDAPFGRDSDWRASAGAGLRFAFPAGSRTTYRLDIAWPIEAGTGAGDFRLRFSVGELIGLSHVAEDIQLRRSRPDGVASDLFRFNSGPGS